MSREVEEKINKAMVALLVRIVLLDQEAEKEKAEQQKKSQRRRK